MTCYEIQAGDTLEAFAERVLGHRLRWISLFSWNASRIGRSIKPTDKLERSLRLYLPAS